MRLIHLSTFIFLMVLGSSMIFGQIAKPLNILDNKTHKNPILCLDISPDSKYLATGGNDGSICVWDLLSGKAIELKSTEYPVAEGNYKLAINDLVFSPDGKYLATASDNKLIGLWDWENEKLVKKLMTKKYSQFYIENNLQGREKIEAKEFTEFPSKVHSLCYSPDGEIIYSGHADNSLKKWTIKDGKREKVSIEHKWSVNSICIDTFGIDLFTGGGDNQILKWSNQLGVDARFSGRGHIKWISKLAIAKVNGVSYLLSSSSDNTICLRDFESGKVLCQRLDTGQSINSFAVSANSGWIATASSNFITIWYIEKDRLRKWESIRAHSKDINDLTFTQDGNYLYSVSDDREIRHWCLDSIIIRRFYLKKVDAEMKTKKILQKPEWYESDKDFHVRREAERNKLIAQYSKRFELDKKLYVDSISKSRKGAIESKRIGLKIQSMSEYARNADDPYFDMILYVVAKTNEKVETMNARLFINPKEAIEFKKVYKNVQFSGIKTRSSSNNEGSNYSISIDRLDTKLFPSNRIETQIE